MKLFHWPYSTALQLYSAGDIVVMAADVEQARAIALKRAETSRLGYSDMDALKNDPWDPESAKDEFETQLHKLKLDLHADPVILEGDQAAIFVNGSE